MGRTIPGWRQRTWTQGQSRAWIDWLSMTPQWWAACGGVLRVPGRRVQAYLTLGATPRQDNATPLLPHMRYRGLRLSNQRRPLSPFFFLPPFMHLAWDKTTQGSSLRLLSPLLRSYASSILGIVTYFVIARPILFLSQSLALRCFIFSFSSSLPLTIPSMCDNCCAGF